MADLSRFYDHLDAVESEFASRPSPFASLSPTKATNQNTSALGDLGTALKIGVQKVPSAVTGLLDIPVAAVTGRPMVSEGWSEIGKLTGFQPSKWAEESRQQYSAGQQQFLQEADQKEGFWDTAGHYLSNPGRAAVQGAESLPGMALGGAYAKALKAVAPAAGVAVRAGAGEGAVMAGQSMNDMVEDGVDPRRAALYATGVGAIGGVLGVAGGRVTQRLGITDPDILIAGGGRAVSDQPMGLTRRVAGGAVSEGLFEEMPQSAMEAVMGNLAAERPWDEGVGKAAAAGAVIGGMMGGAFNIPGARRPVDLTRPGQDVDAGQDIAGYLPPPVQTGLSSEQILQQDVARANAVAAAEARAAELYKARADFEAQRAAAPATPGEVRPDQDPVLDALRTSSENLFTKGGQLKKHVADFVTKWRDASPTEIQQALAELESAKGGVWRIATLEAILATKAQEITNDATQVDAPSNQGASAVAAGGGSLARSGAELSGGVDLTAPAAARRSGAGVSVGEPAGERVAGVARPTEDTPEARAAYVEGVRRSLAQTAEALPATVRAAMRTVLGGFKQNSDVASVLMNARSGLIDEYQAKHGTAPDAKALRAIDTKLAKLHKQLSENADDPVTTSLRAAAAELGVSHETVRNRVNQGIAALREAAEALGVDVGVALEMAGVQQDDAAVYMDSISEAEAAQMGLSYRRSGPRTRVVRSDDAFNLDDASGDYFEEGLGGAVDEDTTADTGVLTSTIDEQATDLPEATVDFDAFAVEEQGRADKVAARTQQYQTELDHNGNPLREIDFEEAAEDYNESVDLDAGDILFEQLDRARQVAYTKAYVANMDGALTAQQLMRVFGEIADGTRQKQATAVGARAAQEEGVVAPVQDAVQERGAAGAKPRGAASEPTTPIEARVADLKARAGEKQTRQIDRWVDRYAKGDIDLERLTTELDTIQGQLDDDTRYSQADTRQGTTADAVFAVLEEIGVANIRRKVTVVQSADLLVERGILNSRMSGSAQGFVKDGKAYFIADNIRPGSERAVVLHEIGAHLGLENILTKQQYAQLVRKIAQWSDQENTLEGRIARRALARMDQADVPDTQAQAELIAYFIEEAVLAGVNPTAMEYKSEIGRWFRTLWAAFKTALRRLGLVNSDRLDAQDVVNLAYGAARLELNATYHGTAANFRRFDHKFMGSGEGAQAFGWGTYLAQRYGIAQGYWEADVRRKGDEVQEVDVDAIDKKLRSEIPQPLRDGLVELMRVVDMFGPGDPGYVFSRAEQRLLDDGNIKAYNFLQQQYNQLVRRERDRPAGNIHHVDVNFTEDEMLDWDASLNDQSPTVLAALEEAGVDYGEYNATVSGKEVYEDLADRLGSDKKASEFLDALGVKGIKFLDSQSRAPWMLFAPVTKGGTVVDTPSRAHNVALEALLRADGDYADADYYVSSPYVPFEDQARAKDILKDWQQQGVTLSPTPPTHNLVVFNDKNIYRVASQRGGPGGEMKFSMAPAADRLRAAGESVFGDKFVKRVLNAWKDPAFKARKLLLGLMTGSQLVEGFKNLVPALADYDRVTRNMTTTAKEWVAAAAPIADRFAALDQAEQKALSEVMVESTLVSFDPSQKDAQPADDRQRKVARMFAALPTAAQQVYTDARDHFERTMKEREATMLGFLAKAFDSRIEHAEQQLKEVKVDGNTKEIRRAERQLDRVKAARKRELETYKRQVAQRKGPYFPLMRFGEHIVIARSAELAKLEERVAAAKKAGEDAKELENRIAEMRKDAKHYQVEAFERPSLADERVETLQAEGWQVRQQLAPQFHRETMAIDNAGMEEIQQYIGEQFGPKVAGQISDMMAELYFRSLPEHHTLQRQIRREGIEGASRDMLRVFSTAAIREAHYISRLKYTDDLRSALFKIKEQGKQGGRDAGAVANEIEARVATDMELSDTPVFDGIANLSYLANLALSPAFYTMNLLQVPMITMPWLNARYGTPKVMPQLQRAYVDTKNLLVSSYKEQGWRAELDLTKLERADERAMMQELLKRNLLDITMEHDLGALANQRYHKRAADALRMVNLPTHITEIANRSVTALAAYRLARDKGMTGAEATDVAAKAVSETQLDYSATNTPRLMRQVFGSRGLAKLVFQFRKYQQGMLWLTVSSMKQAVGNDPEMRQIARSQLKWLFGTHAVMAGTLGIPMAGALGTAAKVIAWFMGDDDDEPFDPNIAWRNMLSDTFGKDVGLLLAKGLPAYVGVDMSKRIGLGDVASPFPFMQTRAGEDGQATLGRMMVAAGGAPLSLVVNAFDALDFMEQGQTLKAWERLIPLKGARDLLRAARIGDEGVTTRTGELALPADRFDGWDLAIRAAGFSPIKESEHYEAKTAIEGARRAITDRRNALLRKYAQARVAGEDTTSIEQDIAEFNSRYPQKGLRIDGSSKLRAVKARRDRVKALNEQGVRVDRQAKPFEPRGRFANV